jgi:hypothetical protein
MREPLILLVIFAVIAIVWWYLRQRNATTAGQGVTIESRQVAQPRTRSREVADGSATNESGLFQDAAASAAGLPYAQAADQMQEMTSEIATARREAERAAERLGSRAAEALTAVQAAAASHGGAVPGDGTVQCPPGYPIKGVMTAMAYFGPDEPAYDRTVPDVCFRNVAAADAAGFGEPGDQAGTVPRAGAADDAVPKRSDASNASD